MILIRRTYILAVIAMTLFLIVSCREDSLQYADKDIAVELDTPIAFALDDLHTKADVTSLSSFHVLCINGALASGYESSVFSDIFYSTGSGYYEGDYYWPNSSVGYSFYASNKSLNMSVSGTYLTAEPLTDVVVAKVSSATYKEVVPLTFNHIYAKIGYCNVTAPSGFTVSGLKVKMTPNTGGRYYVYKGTWSNFTTTTLTLASTTDNTSSIENLIVPGTYTLSLSYTLTKDSYTETINNSLSLTFVAGKKNNIEITLPAGNVTSPGGGLVIDPWEGDEDVYEEM